MVLRPWEVLQDTVVLNIEAFLAVMNTTELVVKIRPEKTAFEPMTSAIPVQIESMQNDLYL